MSRNWKIFLKFCDLLRKAEHFNVMSKRGRFFFKLYGLLTISELYLSQELRDIASRRPAVVKALTIMVKVSAKIKVSIVKLCNM